MSPTQGKVLLAGISLRVQSGLLRDTSLEAPEEQKVINLEALENLIAINPKVHREKNQEKLKGP